MRKPRRFLLLALCMQLPLLCAGKKSPRIAIVNTRPFHLEVVAGLLEELKPYHKSTKVFMHQDALPHQPLHFGFQQWIKEYKGLKLRPMQVLQSTNYRYDFMFFVSPEYDAYQVHQIIVNSRPLMVVLMVHNGDANALPLLFNLHPNTRLVTLAPHVAQYVHQRTGMQVQWMLPTKPLVQPEAPCNADFLQMPPESGYEGLRLLATRASTPFLPAADATTSGDDDGQAHRGRGWGSAVASAQNWIRDRQRLPSFSSAQRAAGPQLQIRKSTGPDLSSAWGPTAPEHTRLREVAEGNLPLQLLGSSSHHRTLLTSSALGRHLLRYESELYEDAASSTTDKSEDANEISMPEGQYLNMRLSATTSSTPNKRPAVPLPSQSDIAKKLKLKNQQFPDGWWKDGPLCVAGFAIQGKLDGRRRNYSAMWDELDAKYNSSAALRNDPRFAINLIGSGRPRGLKKAPPSLQRIIRAHTNLNFQDYYNAIYHNLALVPILASNSYYDRKFSSTVITSLVTGVPIIADDKLLQSYSFLNDDVVFFQQEQENNADTIVKILSLTPDQMTRRRQAIHHLRAQLNENAALLLRTWIDETAKLVMFSKASAGVLRIAKSKRADSSTAGLRKDGKAERASKNKKKRKRLTPLGVD